MSKRGDGEGTIFEEKPGRWVAQMTVGYEVRDGRRRRVRKKFVAATRREAQGKLDQARENQRKGLGVPIQRESVGAYLKRWLDHITRDLSETTVSTYRWIVEKYIAPDLGPIALTKLDAATIDRFLGQKLESGLSRRTVHHIHAVLRNALGQAKRWKAVAVNVASDATPPKQNKLGAGIRPLQPDQAKKFLAAVAGDRLEALYAVALSIGLRRGEALGLQWDDFDTKGGTLTVRRSLRRVGGKLGFGPPKNEASRTIPLPRFALAILTAHRHRQEFEKQVAGDRWIDNGLMFPSSIGTPLEPRNLLRHLHSRLKIIGLPRHRFHDLRHTAASLLLAQGASLHEVKEILGHSQIALTANLYGHIYPAVARMAVDRVGALIGPGEPVAPHVAPLRDRGKVN